MNGNNVAARKTSDNVRREAIDFCDNEQRRSSLPHSPVKSGPRLSQSPAEKAVFSSPVFIAIPHSHFTYTLLVSIREVITLTSSNRCTINALSKSTPQHPYGPWATGTNMRPALPDSLISTCWCTQALVAPQKTKQ